MKGRKFFALYFVQVLFNFLLTLPIQIDTVSAKLSKFINLDCSAEMADLDADER